MKHKPLDKKRKLLYQQSLLSFSHKGLLAKYFQIVNAMHAGNSTPDKKSFFVVSIVT